MESVFNTIRRWGFRRGPDRVLGGIAGAIAAHFNWNLAPVRLIMFVVFLLPGISWGLYALIWALTPWQDQSIPLERALNALSGKDSSF